MCAAVCGQAAVAAARQECTQLASVSRSLGLQRVDLIRPYSLIFHVIILTYAFKIIETSANNPNVGK